MNEKNPAPVQQMRAEQNYLKSDKLAEVLYDIRGPILREAKRLEDEGTKIIHLNTGNPAPFGFDAPDELIHDVIVNLRNAQGYCESRGLFSARKAIMQYYQTRGVPDVDTENIYLGNGVSELIVMSMQGLINNGDEVLIPAPDYPLWTASVNLSGGRAVHYICDEQSEWNPSLEDIRAKITGKTRAIVVINPNNPTGAVYPREILEGIYKIAREHRLIIFADEIYDKTIYDGHEHIALGSICRDIFCITFGGLSKNYRAAGFRSGWMLLSGNLKIARDYQEGLDILSSMRLCANVPAQFAIQASLGGYQSINDLTVKGGRLEEQRTISHELISHIPGMSCVKPKGALYLFPKVNVKKFGITDDARMILDLLVEKKVLLVQGTGFNWPHPDHFRVVFLPEKNVLTDVIHDIADFFSKYHQ
ncbi:MAG: pyridoxal phosphate-dependent aminotransferase [Salinispira sp.]